MSPRSVLCLTVLLLCVCALHARPRLGCKCRGTSARDLGLDSIKKIEVFPVSGSCRRMEIRITRKNGRVVCADPKLKWVQQLLEDIQKINTNAQLSSNQIIS